MSFFRSPKSSVWGTTDQSWATRFPHYGGGERIEVPVVDFRDSLRRFGVPHYAKIDIEGADMLCLQALGEVEQRPAYLSLESEKREFEALEREFDALEALGYDRFALVEQGRIRRTSITTEDLRGKPIEHRFEWDASGPFGDDLQASWRDRASALSAYRRIFVLYRLFGDRSPLERTAAGRWIKRAASTLARRPLPGWYDTHACRGDRR